MIRPNIYWIPIPNLKLAIMPRPRSGEWLEDELGSLSLMGVGMVVSLLESIEVQELGLSQQEVFCKRFGMEFLSFPIPDRGVPSSVNATHYVIKILVERLRADIPVAIHCRAGIGRSGLIAACVLSMLGVSDEFQLISKARGVTVPDTELQIKWLQQFKSLSSQDTHS